MSDGSQQQAKKKGGYTIKTLVFISLMTLFLSVSPALAQWKFPEPDAVKQQREAHDRNVMESSRQAQEGERARELEDRRYQSDRSLMKEQQRMQQREQRQRQKPLGW